MDDVQHAAHQRIGQARDLAPVAQRELARTHRDVGGGERVAAKDHALVLELVAHRVRPQGDAGGTLTHNRAAPQSDREHVGHAKVGPHAPDGVGGGGLSWKAAQQEANVGRCTADVHHHGFLQAREEGRAPDAVGGAGRAGEDGKALRIPGADQRAVVLADVDRGIDAHALEGTDERGDDLARELGQRGVDDGGILPVDQTHTADLRRQRDVGVGQMPAQDGRGALLDVRAHRRKVGGDDDRIQALFRDVAANLVQLILVQWCVFESGVEGAATHQIDVRADDGAQVVWPGHHRWHAVRLRQANAHHRHFGQMAALQEGVDELRRSDHDAADIARRHA